MKNMALWVCMLFVASLVIGPVTHVLAAGKTHQTTAEVVSVDVEGKMLTIKDEKGETKTAPVLDKAVEKLKTLKAGDKVTLTCKDNDKGEHEGITDITVAKVTS